MMDRRAFLARLGFGTVSAAAAALTFDVEKLLWAPGEKTIVIPSPRQIAIVTGLTKGDIITFADVYAINPVTGRETNFLQEFVLTDDVLATPVTKLPVWPPLVTRGPYRTVSRLPKPDVLPASVLMGLTVPMESVWSDADSR